jgi:hypothetical protein
VSNGKAGSRVSVYAKACGELAPRQVATLETEAIGNWSGAVRPLARTIDQVYTP